MTDEVPQSIKEFWRSPKKNRRHSVGRREDDYAVCAEHESIQKDTAERRCRRDTDMKDIREDVATLREQIVGKFTFKIVLSFIGLVVILINVGSSIILKKLVDDVDEIKTSLIRHTAENSPTILPKDFTIK